MSDSNDTDAPDIATPVQPGEAAAPAQPSDTPATPAAATAHVNDTPVQATEDPAQVNDTPVKPGEATAHVNDTPVQGTSAPTGELTLQAAGAPAQAGTVPALRPPPEITAPQPAAATRPTPQRLWLHALLFVLTFLTAVWSQISVRPGRPYVEGLRQALADPFQLHNALMFAGALMTILLAHEMGHYVTARRYGVDQSLPYFIPAPTLVGTFGAVILMRSQPRNRRVLLNVAVMGPYAGLILALPAAAWGLAHSVPVPAHALDGVFHIEFGNSLLFRLLEHFFSPNGDNVALHPVALAGWVGLFVTSLNLIPAAQLDGGHVAYALFGKRQTRISLAVVVILFGMGMFLVMLGQTGGPNWGGSVWIFFALLLFVIGIRHPPVRDETLPLRHRHHVSGWLAFVVFVLTFVPLPVTVANPHGIHNPAELQEPMQQTHPAIPGPQIAPGANPPKKPPPPLGHPPEEFKL